MTLSRSNPRARSRWALLIALVAAGMLVIGVVSTLAVNSTGAFELDGNALSTTGNAGTAADDWDRVCREVVGTDCSTTATTQTADPKSVARTWVDASAEERIFTGGGSKDFKDPENDWLWKPATTVPDKDTIRHAFAARYSLAPNATNCPSTGTTCEVIFFGADRFANDGDAQMGFWFLQNPVSRTDTASGGGFKFSGHHKNGDLLLISNFSNGGTTSTIKAYFWDTSCTKADASENALQVNQCASAFLRLKGQSTAANCLTSASTANFCGIVNPTNGTTAPWAFLDKTGHTAYEQGEFYEAGVNLSGLGIGNECFSTVIAETRASDSISAVLKDIVDMPFGECTSGTATTPKYDDPGDDPDGGFINVPSGGASIGTSARLAVRDQAVITVNGLGGTFGGTVKFYLCGPLTLTSTSLCDGTTGNVGVQIGAAAGETVSGSGGTATVNSATATLTSAGRYCWRAEYSGDSAKGVPGSNDSRATECFKVNPVTPTLTTTASADVTLTNPISDTATLSGTAKKPGTDGVGPGGTINATAGTQAAADGSITWNAYGPNNCTTLAFGPVSRTVSGDNTYPTASQAAVSFTPTAIGKYTFVASYDGSSPNTNAAGPSSCPPGAGDGDEEVNVTGSATLATDQKWLPNDRARIQGPTGTTLSGTVTFRLYNDGTCGTSGGTVQYGPITKNIVTDADSSPAPTANDRYVSTSNSTFFVTAANDAVAWSWKVSYDDANLNDPADKCETTTPAFTLTD